MKRETLNKKILANNRGLGLSPTIPHVIDHPSLIVPFRLKERGLAIYKDRPIHKGGSHAAQQADMSGIFDHPFGIRSDISRYEEISLRLEQPGQK